MSKDRRAKKHPDEYQAQQVGQRGFWESGNDSGDLRSSPAITVSMFQRQWKAPSALNEAIFRARSRNGAQEEVKSNRDQ